MIPENCDDSRKKTSPQPTPSSQLRANGLSENSQPPIPPSQNTKPSMASDHATHGMREKSKSHEEVGDCISKPAGEQHQRHPGPLVPPKKKPEIPEKPGTQQGLDRPDPGPLIQTAPELSDSVPTAEDSLPKNKVPSLVVSQLDDDLGASSCGLDEENKTKAEEKSVDSGQHSDDDSDGSRSGDTLAVSTAAMRGSHAGLDAMDSSEEDLPSLCYSRIFGGTQPSNSAFKEDPCQSSEADPQAKPSTKAKSASFGDLLSDCATCFEQHVGTVAAQDGPCCHDVRKLEDEILLEINKTRELLNKASQSQRGGDGDEDEDENDEDDDGEGRDNIPESLLAKAMEKLKKAEYVLREAKKLKSGTRSTNRKSW